MPPGWWKKRLSILGSLIFLSMGQQGIFLRHQRICHLMVFGQVAVFFGIFGAIHNRCDQKQLSPLTCVHSSQILGGIVGGECLLNNEISFIVSNSIIVHKSANIKIEFLVGHDAKAMIISHLIMKNIINFSIFIRLRFCDCFTHEFLADKAARFGKY